jgi:hypothetical protein
MIGKRLRRAPFARRAAPPVSRKALAQSPSPASIRTSRRLRLPGSTWWSGSAEITRKRIRRGTFKSVAELKSAIMECLENHNADPKPFIWTKSAGQILEKVARTKQALESQH